MGGARERGKGVGGRRGGCAVPARLLARGAGAEGGVWVPSERAEDTVDALWTEAARTQPETAFFSDLPPQSLE